MVDKLKFVKQEEIGQEYKLHLPQAVQNILFCGDEENKLIWNCDWKKNEIILSNQSLGENQSQLVGIRNTDNTLTRVTIPKEIRKGMQLDIGDDLYFLAIDGVSNYKPSVFIFQFEKVEQLIMSNTVYNEIFTPRFPNF